MRERGQRDEAERIRTGELADMVAALRTPDETEATLNDRLAALFAQESERVANAAVIAELLAPALAESLRPALATHAVVSSPPPEENVVPETPKPAPVRAGVASIADFIDEMIAQESSGPRASRGARQRGP